MTVAESSGDFLLILLYWFIIQSIFALIGIFFKEKRTNILNIHALIGLVPCVYVFPLLLEHHKTDFWVKWDSMFLFYFICSLINIFLLMLIYVLKMPLNKFRWYFFIVINTVGGYMVSFLLNR